MKLFVMRLAAAVVLIVCARPSGGQSTFGNIVGSVKDPTDAAVPAAAISIRDLDENLVRTTASNDQGLYQMLNLRPGRYEITASKPGFAAVKIGEVRLEARQELRQDIRFEVASVTETVMVNATVTALNTENATIADSKDNRQITQLPINYRGATTSPLSAILTIPGVQQDTGGQYSVAGGMPTMIEYTVDGVSTVSVRSNGPLSDMYPSSEMLSEFKVTSINNNAEFSQMGDVTVSTKSGTNQLHGSAFWYHQNRALDATTYGASVKQAKVFNSFGGSFSGPVEIPKVYDGRNRTFFYGTYEGNRRPGSQLLQFTVPTAGMDSGNLAGLPGGAAVDPLSGTAFPDNTIPQPHQLGGADVPRQVLSAAQFRHRAAQRRFSRARHRTVQDQRVRYARRPRHHREAADLRSVELEEDSVLLNQRPVAGERPEHREQEPDRLPQLRDAANADQ
jgi:hypothetical protein